MSRTPDRVFLFAELCAGTAAVSLRLQGGRSARPPVSRMGSKAGYAQAILRCLGLRAGSGAEKYLFCEPDPGCRLLLTAYTDAELRRSAAEIIRGWKNEDPRKLWERLRSEGPVKGSEADPREVARWSCGMLWTVAGTWPRGGFCGPGHVSKSGKVPFPSGTTYQRHIAARYDRLPSLPASILPDARAVDPPQLPPGCYAYIDPPYAPERTTGQKRTGYQHNLSRSEVCELAERWAAAGAIVAISEAEPITELSGWHTVEISGERHGQKRTFSRQTREFLTLSEAPRWRPSIQRPLSEIWG